MAYYRHRKLQKIIFALICFGTFSLLLYQFTWRIQHRDVLPVDIGLPTVRSRLTTKDVFPYSRTPVDLNCTAIFEGVNSEIELAISRENINTSIQYISDEVYIKDTTDCVTFKRSRGYITAPLTKDEELFPIAYSMVVYEDANQIERLLRTLYNPQNYYCIHMDVKSSSNFRRVISGIAKCFDNVFISSRSVSVVRKSDTVLLPDLICMEDLWKYEHWKYWFNLAGNEFPLHTNLEFVQILKTLNESNHIQGIIKRANTERWRNAGPAPHNIRLRKGSMHIVATRAFIDYVLHDSVAQDFLNWTRKTDFPEETFFPSLNYNPHLNVPGGFRGNLTVHEDTLRFFGRFVNWVILEKEKNGRTARADYPCHGKFVHGICVFGVSDLPLIASRPELFVNKLYRYYQPYVLDCLEEWLYNRTRAGYLVTRPVNTDVFTQQFGWSNDHLIG